jgi:predicted HAD superfamily hydrolase
MEMRHQLSACLDDKKCQQSLSSNFHLRYVGQLCNCVMLSLIDDCFVIFILFFYVKVKNYEKIRSFQIFAQTIGLSDCSQIDQIFADPNVRSDHHANSIVNTQKTFCCNLSLVSCLYFVYFPA